MDKANVRKGNSGPKYKRTGEREDIKTSRYMQRRKRNFHFVNC
jgi:hypothetical protein